MKFIFVLGVLLMIAAIVLAIVSLVLKKKFGEEKTAERLGVALISLFCGTFLCALYEALLKPEYESVRATRYYIEEVVTYRDSIPCDTTYIIYYK